MTHRRSCRQPGLRPIRGARPGVWLAVCLAGLLAGPVAAGEPALVKAALDAIPVKGAERCAYTRVVIDGGDVEVERFDPRRADGRWQLVSVGGQPPDAEAQRRYDAKGDDRAERNHPLDLEFRNRVDPASWRKTSDDGLLVEYQFKLQPHGELTERLAERLVGTFVVDKRARQPIRIRLENTEPVSIAPLVRIAHYADDTRFEFDRRLRAAVPSERRTERRGRALGVKPLNRSKTYRYENYVCAQAADRPRTASAGGL